MFLETLFGISRCVSGVCSRRIMGLIPYHFVMILQWYCYSAPSQDPSFFRLSIHSTKNPVFFGTPSQVQHCNRKKYDGPPRHSGFFSPRFHSTRRISCCQEIFPSLLQQVLLSRADVGIGSPSNLWIYESMVIWDLKISNKYIPIPCGGLLGCPWQPLFSRMVDRSQCGAKNAKT